MKKIIGILAVLLITTGVFGQINLGNLSYIEQYNWKHTTETAHFTTTFNGYTFYYILAYEPNFRGLYEGSERNVYLYSYETDSPDYMKEGKYADKRVVRWTKASDAVLENYYHDGKNYQDVDFYRYNKDRRNTSNSSVEVVGDNVIFTLNVYKMENGRVSITSQTFTLKLEMGTFGDGNFYKLKK